LLPFDGVVTIEEERSERVSIRLNHYLLQSFDFFMKVKATRGDVACASADAVRNSGYFSAADAIQNAVYDDRLHKKRMHLQDP
jgi:hypothetical protein